MADLTVTFEPPAKVWSINERLHWSKRRALTSAWRGAADLYTRRILKSRKVRPGRFLVQVTLPFQDNRRRDPHNYTGTVVKAMVDGLVDAGVFPDDTPEFVSVAEPWLTVGGKQVVVIEVTRAGD